MSYFLILAFLSCSGIKPIPGANIKADLNITTTKVSDTDASAQNSSSVVASTSTSTANVTGNIIVNPNNPQSAIIENFVGNEVLGLTSQPFDSRFKDTPALQYDSSDVEKQLEVCVNRYVDQGQFVITDTSANIKLASLDQVVSSCMAEVPLKSSGGGKYEYSGKFSIHFQCQGSDIKELDGTYLKDDSFTAYFCTKGTKGSLDYNLQIKTTEYKPDGTVDRSFTRVKSLSAGTPGSTCTFTLNKGTYLYADTCKWQDIMSDGTKTIHDLVIQPQSLSSVAVDPAVAISLPVGTDMGTATINSSTLVTADMPSATTNTAVSIDPTNPTAIIDSSVSTTEAGSAASSNVVVPQIASLPPIIQDDMTLNGGIQGSIRGNGRRYLGPQHMFTRGGMKITIDGIPLKLNFNLNGKFSLDGNLKFDFPQFTKDNFSNSQISINGTIDTKVNNGTIIVQPPVKFIDLPPSQ